MQAWLGSSIRRLQIYPISIYLSTAELAAARLTFPSGKGARSLHPDYAQTPMARSTPPPELADARRQGLHNIGEASAATGVSAKMIRAYERAGMIPPPPRTFAGYRLYADADLQRLRFIKRARLLGFPLKRIEQLLGLWNDRGRASAGVKTLALAHAAELAARIAQMQSMQRALESLARDCQGDERPECPILEELARPAQ